MRITACAVPLLLMGSLSLAGCKLVDQTSFGGAPRAPAPSELATALASHGGDPILVIRPDDGTPYAEALRQALDAAEIRKPDAHFRLAAVSPAQGEASAQQAGLDTNTVAARAVLDEMGVNGISPDRVTLSASTEKNLTHREIRLFQD